MNLSKLLAIIPAILAAITPELREELKAGLERLEQKAKATKNPVDDLVVGLLRGVLGI